MALRMKLEIINPIVDTLLPTLHDQNSREIIKLNLNYGLKFITLEH